MTGNKIDILYCGRSRFLLLEKFFLSCLNYKRSQSPSQRQWVCDENTEDKVLWLVASVGKVVLCESLSSTINIIPSLDNDNYAQETRWSCPGHWSATHTIIHYWTSSTHWMTFYLAEAWSTDLDGVIPNVVFTHQLHFSCSYLQLSEYTADTLSSNQNRVDHRKWNFNVIFTLAHL